MYFLSEEMSTMGDNILDVALSKVYHLVHVYWHSFEMLG